MTNTEKIDFIQDVTASVTNRNINTKEVKLSVFKQLVKQVELKGIRKKNFSIQKPLMTLHKELKELQSFAAYSKEAKEELSVNERAAFGAAVNFWDTSYILKYNREEDTLISVAKRIFS